jgi:probable HAF family extracellular repeat protein
MSFVTPRINSKTSVALFLSAVSLSIVAAPSWGRSSLPVLSGPKYIPDAAYDNLTQSFPIPPGKKIITNSGVALGYSYAQIFGVAGQSTLWGRPVRWDFNSGAGAILGGVGSAPDHRENVTPVWINDSGIAIGSALKYSDTGVYLNYRAVRWDAAGNVTELGNLGTATNGATTTKTASINAAGTIIGVADVHVNGVRVDARPVRWDAGSTVAIPLDGTIAFVPGQQTVRAYDINDSGTIVGGESLFVNDVRTNSTLLWVGGSTTPQVLGIGAIDPQGMSEVHSHRISNSGFVSGSFRRSAGTKNLGDRAIRWDVGGTVSELQPLGYRADGYTDVRIRDMNEAGTVVGEGDFFVGGVAKGTRAVRWDAASNAPIMLGTLSPNDKYCTASGVNNLGAVVGYTGITGAPNAVVWNANSTIPLDLNTLLAPGSNWQLSHARDISDTGFITGEGIYDPDGAGPAPFEGRYFLMLVPQAGTYGKGDANFDTRTDFADLVILAQKYDLANPTRATNVADFDLNGVTDFQDLIVLAQNYNAGVASIEGLGSADFAADWALAQSLVPEPVGLAGLAAVLLLARRRSQVP